MSEQALSSTARDFIEQATAEAENIFQVFRETGTITANGTVGFVERVPGEDVLVSLNYPGPWKRDQAVQVTAASLDNQITYIGKPGIGGGRYNKLFQQHADVTTISHVHSPFLGAWAQTHRPLPIRYVPVQRFKLFKELPVYVDRRQQEVDFILDKIAENPHTSAIIEANGGATVWGKQGLHNLAEFILLLEEGAQIQINAEAIGGSRDYGPGVLAQQWRMSKLYDQANSLGLLPATDRPAA